MKSSHSFAAIYSPLVLALVCSTVVCADPPEPKIAPPEKAAETVDTVESEAPSAASVADAGSTEKPRDRLLQPVMPPVEFDRLVPRPEGTEAVVTPSKSDVPPVPQPKPQARPSLPKLSPAMAQRRQRVQSVLDVYAAQRISTSKRSPWGLMHAMIPFGAEAMISASGRDVNAVSWLCANGNGRNLRLFYTKDNKIQIRVGPGLQGHEGQFLAMMAQSRIAANMPLTVGEHKFTLQDVIDYEMASCRDGTELTFKLIGLVHYLPSDKTWQTSTGQTYDIPRLIREELKQTITGAACGGTHRLMGFSYAVRKRKQRGEPINGEWQRAQQFVNKYLAYSRRLVNPDGSYSTDWYKGRGMDRDLDRRVQTTGHMLEWVVFSSPQERLDDRDITRSVDYLTNLLMRRRREELEVGPRGHAIRALVLYNDRMFVNPPTSKPRTRVDLDLATRPENKATADADLR